jgi:tRNA pseudouridine38-40 synthase
LFYNKPNKRGTQIVLRIQLYIEYDGTEYAGWQRQENALSVQQVVEECLSKLTGEAITITGAGRTDAGVHAAFQAAHFDTDAKIPAERFAYALNFTLPPSIRIKKSIAVPDDFHARYSAKSKWYRYTVYNHPHASALNRQTNYHMRDPLDTASMDEAARCMAGTHDFAAFAASGAVQKTTIRTVYDTRVTREGDFVYIDIKGSGFLYNMVRIFAGTLIEIGRHRMDITAIQKMIDTGDRLEGGPTAPARGLMLMRVYYEWDEDKYSGWGNG